MQMNDRALRHLGVSTCVENVGEGPRGRSTTAIAWPLTRGKESTRVADTSPGNWGSSVVARSQANLFVIERAQSGKRWKKKKEANPVEQQQDGEEEATEERSCFAYRRIYEPAEPVVSLSPRGKFQPPNGGLWYRRKVAALCLPLFLSLARCNTANQRSRCGCSSSISLSLSLFLRLSSLPGLIDEFIASTARSIVTKIVYDIDSSFYVNPVSEWFWSTCRGRAFCIRTRTREEENITMSCERVRRIVVRVVSEGRGRDELSTNLRGNGRSPETHGSVALCHRYAN